jgi:hypothetical protein
VNNGRSSGDHRLHFVEAERAVRVHGGLDALVAEELLDELGEVSDALEVPGDAVPEGTGYGSIYSLYVVQGDAMTIKSNSTSDESVIVVTFDPSLSGDQVEATLTALANYFRHCGGVGLSAEFESQEAVTEEVHA